jgi:hypothetical protein
MAFRVAIELGICAGDLESKVHEIRSDFLWTQCESAATGEQGHHGNREDGAGAFELKHDGFAKAAPGRSGC